MVKKIPKITELTFFLELLYFSIHYRQMLARTECKYPTAEIRSDETHLVAAFVS